MEERRRFASILLLASLCFVGLGACGESAPEAVPAGETASNGAAASSSKAGSNSPSCLLVEEGYGPQGAVEVQAEEVVTGLEVPWGLAFLPGGGMLVTERPGRLRLVEDGQLRASPVATVDTRASGEGGLLGIALHPDFASNRLFYLYYTARQNGAAVNRVEQWRLSEDRTSAQPEQVILGGIPAATFHNGGRLHFGPDGMLYVGTGDARNPELAQDTSSLAGKLLRLTPEGEVPEDNPFPGSPVYFTGIRNTQGFDWPSGQAVWLVDHGPSGEMGRTGHDEVNVAHAGDNLGWPTIYGCQSEGSLVTPSLTWDTAVPPGGATIYTGSDIPEWKGSLIIGTLGSRHLHRVAFGGEGGGIQRHSVNLRGDRGRLRTVRMSPAGGLLVMTSNCDGRGNCPPDGDKILRITR